MVCRYVALSLLGTDTGEGVASRDSDILLKIRSTDPRDDKTRIEQQKGGLLRDSYKWILSHEDFLKWRDGEGYQLLWVRGDPGKGKTMLLCGVIDELNKSRTDDWNIAYFFCQGTNHQLRKASFVLQGLIFSLLSQQPRLLDCVREDIDLASKEIFQDLNGWAALCRIFGRLIKEIEDGYQTVYLIVDGLDECLEDRRHLLEWIARLSSPSIRLLISSRNWPLIEDGLSGATRKVLLHLELNDRSILAAVDSYIDHKVMELEMAKGLGSGLREAVRRHLKSHSNNTFLWVALVCKELCREDTHSWEVLKLVEKFPSGLNELYNTMARHVLASKDATICLQVLSIQALAYRPLTIAELFSIADLDDDIIESSLHKVVGLCGSFLMVKTGTIYFVHQSAKDYLIKSIPESLFPQGLPDAGHRTMAIQLIQALEKTLRENMYQLPSPGSRIDNIIVPSPHPLDGIRYACVYWADHLVDAGLVKKQDFEHVDLVRQFLEKYLLHWFEALSLLKSLGLGIKVLENMLSLLQTSPGEPTGGGSVQALQDFVCDALKFLRYHMVGIGTAPLQVYTSALIFSPTSSLVRQAFLRKPEWLPISPTGKSQWDSAGLQTLEGHTGIIKWVTFAPNGKYLASGAEDDDTTRIWDTTTGECLKTLKGHGSGVRSIAFSPNCECLASSSENGTIRIWSTVTGICLQTLEYPTGGCVIVAFLDDRNIISIDAHTKVYSWDTATGQRVCHRTAPGRDWTVDYLFLSNSGERAAWARKHISHDNIMTIEVVDTVAGQYYKTPWSKTERVMSMAFNGKYVAIYSRLYNTEHLYATVFFKIWNLATCECMTLPCITELKCRALALSPDNEYIGAETMGGLCEYNIATGQLVEVKAKTTSWRYGIGSFRSYLAYSPDSRLLILGGERVVQVPDMSAARLQHGKPQLGHSDSERNSNSNGDSDTSCELTLPPNGTLLGVKRKLVRRKPRSKPRKSETHLQLNSNDDNNIISAYSHTRHGLILSPDGTFLGIGDCNDFQTWNLVKNKRISTIAMSGWYQWSPNLELQSSFSPENKYLACRSWSEGLPVFELFDTATGRCLWRASDTDALEWVLLGGRICVALLSFRGHVRIRDTATGKTLSEAYVCTGDIQLAGLSCDGKKLAFQKYCEDICVWDVAADTRTCRICLRIEESDSPLISSLKFSPDSRYVIAFQGDGNIIHLADATTGTRLKVLRGFGHILSAATGLQTERGVFHIADALLHHSGDYINYEDISAPQDNFSGLGISPNGDWILRNGEPYLWLPIQLRHYSFRPGKLSMARNTIVFGDGPGEVYCIRLDSLSQARL